MIGGIVTLAFVVLMLLVGRLLFDTNDWGRPVTRNYKGNRPGGIDMSSTIEICERIVAKLK